MTPQWKHLLVGLGVVALTVGALPMASGFGAAPIAQPAVHQVNRALKSDRLLQSVVAKRKVPVQVIREIPPEPETAKRKPMDGCEPLFSPVTVPSAAHLTGRCVG